MKVTSALLVAGLIFTSQAALGCDEACRKEAAEKKQSVSFPGYLSWQYCEDLKLDFMTTDMGSLQSYSSKHFDTKYKGPIRNTVRFLDQRKEWLAECDNYLSLTDKGRIFYDAKTTSKVFGEIDSVKSELQLVLEGATYSSAQGDETKVIVGEKFDSLFQAVDDHKNLMHLKGKYVYQ